MFRTNSYTQQPAERLTILTPKRDISFYYHGARFYKGCEVLGIHYGDSIGVFGKYSRWISSTHTLVRYSTDENDANFYLNFFDETEMGNLSHLLLIEEGRGTTKHLYFGSPNVRKAADKTRTDFATNKIITEPHDNDSFNNTNNPREAFFVNPDVFKMVARDLYSSRSEFITPTDATYYYMEEMFRLKECEEQSLRSLKIRAEVEREMEQKYRESVNLLYKKVEQRQKFGDYDFDSLDGQTETNGHGVTWTYSNSRKNNLHLLQ